MVKLLTLYTSSLGGYVFSLMLLTPAGWETAWNAKGMVLKRTRLDHDGEESQVFYVHLRGMAE
jgi:hypothetical protein